MEVPASLKRLLRLVLRGFYDVEHTLVIDLLIRRLYLTEEEIEDYIKFEKKQLRNVVQQLRNEKILQARIKMETTADKKSRKVNYYYINFRGFVNVVKYKLDHMRRKIETEERDNTKRASFVCINCKKTFTDLEADQLFNPVTQEFNCNYCDSPVEEDSSAQLKPDSRTLLAKFNEQIQPLYVLLKEVENLNLPPELLEPEPIESVLSIKKEEENQREWNSVDKNRGINNAYESMMLRERSLTVSIENVPDSIVAGFFSGSGDLSNALASTSAVETIASAAATRHKKERPAWLVESTVFDNSSNDISIGSINGGNSASKKLSENANSSSANGLNGYHNGHAEDATNGLTTKEILEALLIYENQNENNLNSTNLSNGFKDPFEKDKSYLGNSYHHSSNHGDQHFDEQEQYEVYRLPYVRVGGKPIMLNEITEKHLPLMSPLERDEFTKLSQEVYSCFYD